MISKNKVDNNLYLDNSTQYKLGAENIRYCQKITGSLKRILGLNKGYKRITIKSVALILLCDIKP